ncbi:MAG TPA: NRDE family protein [Thermoanaerobaculaceae bacterium]|nr:NRDE family protein [Thermoanaerobaculaceae bacterium]
MCILLAIRRPAGEGELWVAANRDERLDRPWQPPQLLVPDPPVFGGRDLVGGGSWLAVNLRAGFVVGVTNARLGIPPAERSRGRLVVDLAAEQSLADAGALLSELDLSRYGPFDLMLADARECWLATNSPEASIEARRESVVAVGNDPLAEPGERVMDAARRGRLLAGLPEGELASSLATLLADHEGADPLCRHGDGYGTVCSTILVLRGTTLADYRFAPGPPCTTPFATLLSPSERAPDA